MVFNEKPAVDVTLIVCTFNRARDLHELLETAVVQETGGEFTYEVLVVDNNSTDETREVVEHFISAGPASVRYLFEAKQGKSHALNTGLKAAQGHIYTIVDDDFILPSSWVLNIYRAFRLHPEVSFIGGKVLPLWQEDPPPWLTREHWSAIAMADYGEEEFYTDADHQICLLACSFRTADVKAAGGYRPELGVTSGQIGGTEDIDLLQRLWQSGRKGIYLPHIWFHHKVTADRGTKQYHRRWHQEHGVFYAVMREKEFESSSARFFDVPAHVYRQAVRNAAALIKHSLLGKSDQAFDREIELRFLLGFMRKRYQDFRATGSSSAVREVATMCRFLLKRNST